MSKYRNLLGCLDTKRHRCKVGIKAARQIKSYAVKIFNYNHERVLKRHTEDNSPKYRMVDKMISTLRSFAYAQDDSNVVGLVCNDYLKSFSGSINANLNIAKQEPSPEFLSSLQLTKKFNPQHKADRVTHIAQLCGSLCLTKREGNNFTDKVYSPFTYLNDMDFSLKRPAFTLAEVLITLGIIGVVAAMTMPSLITNYRKKQTVVQLKKVYSELSQAAQMSVIQNGDMRDWNYALTGEEFFNTYLGNFVKMSSQSVEDAKKAGVVYKRASGEEEVTFTNLYDSGKIFTLASGSQIIMDTLSSLTTTRQTILVDLNGFKKPNKLGIDVFAFSVTHNGVQTYKWDDGETVDVTRDRETLHNGPSKHNYQCNNSGRGFWCAAMIEKDGWEINKDYPW